MTPLPDIDAFLREVFSSRGYLGQIVHQEIVPPRPTRHASPRLPLPPAILRSLSSQGIPQLYLHQARSLDLTREGRHVVVVTSTASGKTLCYNLPVLESLLTGSRPGPPQGPAAPPAPPATPHSPTALYLFPTKALAQDQLKAIHRLAGSDPELAGLLRAGTYDGDTSREARRKLRHEGNVLLTNPDMLHQGILPYHTRWNRFFAGLRYVVVDEIHTYRGIFGSHVGNVLRRLRRVARFHGADPIFIASSATIANPRELAERLLGLAVEVVDEDGSPRGKKTFVLWNPPFVGQGRMERRSSNVEGHDLMTLLVEKGIQTIAFTKARVVAELVLRYVRESLERRGSGRGDRVKAYRAGYLPEERRAIERDLFSGRLLGVVSTNALELGIDVGTLDASLLIGFPGTIASTWQQAGRAGRKTNDALVILIAYNDPIDQYLMRHPQYFFGSSPEHAVVDPENPHILASHVCAAAFELPLTEEDTAFLGDRFPERARALAAEGRLKFLEGRWYWSSTDFPARGVSLRTISDATFTIIDRGAGHRTLGTVDSISAPELVYPGGVYLHEGETYLVKELDLASKVAYVERAEVDYYTQPILDSSIRIQADSRHRSLAGTEIFFGPATVTWRTSAFRKIQFYGLDSIGYGTLDLPPQHLETSALWLTPGRATLAHVRDLGENPIDGLSGMRNIFIAVLPFMAMCDRQDVGGIVDSSNTGSPTIFLYDRYPGGLGFAEKGYERAEELLERALALVRDCPCEEGCPSCVGLPILRPAQHQDPDIMGRWPIPSKRAALAILEDVVAGLRVADREEPAGGDARARSSRGVPGIVHPRQMLPPSPLDELPRQPVFPPPAPSPLASPPPSSSSLGLPSEGLPRRGEDLAARYVAAIATLREAHPRGQARHTTRADVLDDIAHPAWAGLAEAGPEGILFFDLETTGFAGTPLFLAGLMHFDGRDFQIRQLFARHYGEEAEVVGGILAHMSRFQCLVTFNGKTFDLPFLRERAVAHRLSPPPDLAHVDLLHAARRRWGTLLPDCRLSTLEWHVCRRRRAGDVQGAEIPDLYHRFVRDGDPQPLGPVIQHNRLDLITLAEILVELVTPGA